MASRRGVTASVPPAAAGDSTVGTRQRLIDAAVDLFLNIGYQGVRISDITKRAGLGKGTFYLHFDDKRDLLLACFRNVVQTVEAEGAEFEAAHLDYFSRAARRAGSGVDPEGHWANIDTFLRVYTGAADREIAAVARDVHSTLRRLGVAEITEAIASGVAREIDPELWGLTIAGMTEVLAWRLRRDDSYDAGALLVLLEDIHVRMLTPAPCDENACEGAAAMIEAAEWAGERARAPLLPADADLDTRGKIIRAAAGLLLDVGYHDLRVDDLAEHAGIGKGTFYHHFSSKRDLLLAYFRLVMERVEVCEALIAERGFGHLERAGFRMGWWLQPEARWDRALTFIRVQANSTDPEIAAAAWEAYRRVLRPLIRDLQHAQREGPAREFDAELAALALAGMKEVLGWRIDQDRTYESATVLSFMADMYCRVFLR